MLSPCLHVQVDVLLKMYPAFYADIKPIRQFSRYNNIPLHEYIKMHMYSPSIFSCYFGPQMKIKNFRQAISKKNFAFNLLSNLHLLMYHSFCSRVYQIYFVWFSFINRNNPSPSPSLGWMQCLYIINSQLKLL